MKSLLLLVLFVASCEPTFPAERVFGSVKIDTVISVYDGDTFTGSIARWPRIIGSRIDIRVKGVDCPEMKDSRDSVRVLAKQAQALAARLLFAAKKVEIRNMVRDKYFRICADIYVDSARLADSLLAAGLARPYDGGTKEAW